MKSNKRAVEVLVLSDIHLGTYGCHAKELIQYLKSIKPKKVILNGDIIDIWQFNKHYWPAAHMQVVKIITGWIAKGVKVFYITGNHDEMLRRFSGFTMGTLKIVNKVVLKLDGKKTWFFHGDVFDVTMQHSKWLAKLGAVGYDLLILLNRMVNFFSLKLGQGKISLSKRIKDSVKGAVKFINAFEQTAADIGIHNGYDFVACGHIHKPEIREMSNEHGHITYLNSGDWVENLTSLEYNAGAWTLYKYSEDTTIRQEDLSKSNFVSLNNSQLFENLMKEFNAMKRDF